MNRQDEREREWQETLEVAAMLKESANNLPKNDAPRPGELYLSRRTTEPPTAWPPVEWLILERDAGRCRAVPVDDYPLAGSRDVPLSTPATGGVAVARCGVDAWADVRAFEADLRTAILDAEDLERVRARQRAVEDGALEPTLLEEVADGDPEYALWVDGTLRPAARALTEEPGAKVLPFVRRVGRGLRRHGGWLAAAALLLVLLGLAVVNQRLSQSLDASKTRVAELETRDEEQAARLAEEARQRRTAEQEAGRLESLLSEAEAAREAFGEQLADVRRELIRALDTGVTINVRELVFGRKASVTRSGGQREIVVVERPEDKWLFLKIEIVDPEPYPLYRVELVPRKSGIGAPIVIDGLGRSDAWLRFGLPGAELAPGEYDVTIYGLGLGEPQKLDELYRLTVEP